MKTNFRLNKKTGAIVGVISLILVLIIVFLIFKPKDNSLVNMGDIMNEQASSKDEEQLKIHSMILRNSTWGQSTSDIIKEEEGNILDISKGKYITCDYETLLDVKFLPTYLFDNDKLVAILYEADLSQSDLSQLSLIHQNLSVNIHYVYEKLYRENNKWKTGQERKYDTNLWTKAILDGNLVLQSIWNSSDEKVFLLTNNSPYFGFLEKEKDRDLTSALTFLIISDSYLAKNSFNDLVKITPTDNYENYTHSENSDTEGNANEETDVEDNANEVSDNIVNTTNGSDTVVNGSETTDSKANANVVSDAEGNGSETTDSEDNVETENEDNSNISEEESPLKA